MANNAPTPTHQQQQPPPSNAPTPQQMPSMMMHPHNNTGGGYNPYGGFFPNMPPMMPPMNAVPASAYPPPHPPTGFLSPPRQPTIDTLADKDQKPEVHVITLHPRGLPRPFDTPFPERRLPVCDKCKKNYKSRDLCRTRDGHKTLPWTTTYVAVTVDPSLLEQDVDGKLSYRDVPCIAILMETPILCLGPSNGSMKSEPICKVCREKNYTREYCRGTCKHTTPPWSTTYVKLVADTRNEGESRKGYGGFMGRHTNHRGVKRRKKSVEEDEEDGKIKSGDGMGGGVESEGLGAYDASYEGEDGRDLLESDDLTVVHGSRTFLASVSSKSVIVRWCERIQYPESAENTTLETALKKLKEEGNVTNPDSSTNQTIHSNTPNNNNTMTDYRLWEAFRAGVMWATQQQANHGQIPPPQGYGYMPQGYFGQHLPPPGPDMTNGGPWGPMFGFGPMNPDGGGQVGTPSGGVPPQNGEDGEEENSNNEANHA